MVVNGVFNQIQNTISVEFGWKLSEELGEKRCDKLGLKFGEQLGSNFGLEQMTILSDPGQELRSSV